MTSFTPAIKKTKHLLKKWWPTMVWQKVVVGLSVLIILPVIAGAALWWTTNSFNEVFEYQEVVSTIDSTTAGRDTIIINFLLRPSQELADQWKEKESAVNQVLIEAHRTFTGTSYEPSLREIEKADQQIVEDFRTFIFSHNLGEQEGGEGESLIAAHRHRQSEESITTEEKLIKKIITDESRIDDILADIEERLNQQLAATRDINARVIGALAATAMMLIPLFGLMLFFSGVLPLRRLVRRVRKLRSDGTEGARYGGHLINRDDEIGLLTEELNILMEESEESRKVLLNQKERTQTILESIGDGLIVVDERQHITLVNKAAEDMLGWRREELSGQPFARALSLVTADAVDIDYQRRPLVRVIEKEVTVTSSDMEEQLYFTSKDQSTFPISFTATPIVIEGQIRGAAIVFRDITNRLRVEKLKSDFISIASHQLRTPLTSIQWVIERLSKREARLSKRARDYLDDIRSSIGDLTDLVNVLLNASRVEEGSIAVVPEEVEIVGFVEQIIGELMPLCEKKDIEVLFTERPEELVVVSDTFALRNIIQSLLSNAIEYTQSGGTITLSLEKQKKTFKLTVADTGIGIPEEEQDQIFTQFFRASNAGRVKPGGTGLGLYIAKRATELLGGEIWFRSIEGRGTHFFVKLPLSTKARKGEKRFA